MAISSSQDKWSNTLFTELINKLDSISKNLPYEQLKNVLKSAKYWSKCYFYKYLCQTSTYDSDSTYNHFQPQIYLCAELETVIFL